MTTCDNCKEHTTQVGHMCSPKKNTEIYECVSCGIISVDKHLLCKPKPLKLKE